MYKAEESFDLDKSIYKTLLHKVRTTSHQLFDVCLRSPLPPHH